MTVAKAGVVLQTTQDFLASYNIQTRADQVPVSKDCAGVNFIITDSDNGEPFEMSFDGQLYFTANVGLSFSPVNGFKKIWVRSIGNVPVSVNFLAGNIHVTDARLNIVRDPNQILSVGAKVPKTYTVNSNGVVPANGFVNFVGVNAGNQRKDIYIFNLDGVNTLGVATAAGLIGGIVYPQDNLPLETSDTIKLMNQNGADVPYCVMEIYYSP